MNTVLEILKYTIPALVVFITAYSILSIFFKSQKEQKQMELALKYQSEIVPIKLQAYERLVIFLERMFPESLVIRENSVELNNQQLQRKLILAIRTEFEHNISQQIYVSETLWTAIKKAKDSTIQLINAEATQTVPNQPSIELGKAIIEAHMQLDIKPIAVAISLAKEEIKLLG